MIVKCDVFRPEINLSNMSEVINLKEKVFLLINNTVLYKLSDNIKDYESYKKNISELGVIGIYNNEGKYQILLYNRYSNYGGKSGLPDIRLIKEGDSLEELKNYIGI